MRQRPKGSATAKVKIKFNPADASQIQVWNSRMKPRKEYVELPNLDKAYVRGGLGFWHHRVIKAFAKADGMEFKTAEDRIAARDRLRVAIENASPDMKMRAMRNYRRLKDPAKPSCKVMWWILPGSTRILAIDDRSVPVVIAAEDRADGGSPGKGPRRGGRKAQDKAAKTRSRNASTRRRQFPSRRLTPLPRPRHRPSRTPPTTMKTSSGAWRTPTGTMETKGNERWHGRAARPHRARVQAVPHPAPQAAERPRAHQHHALRRSACPQCA